MAMKPMRALNKIFVSRIDQNMLPAEHARAIATCLAASAGHVPWLGAAAHLVLRHTEGVREVEINAGKYNAGSLMGGGLDKGGIYFDRPPHSAFVFFAEHYDINVGVVMRVDEWIRTRSTPFVCLSDHPDLSVVKLESMLRIDV
jgi:hypothetical protein